MRSGRVRPPAQSRVLADLQAESQTAPSLDNIAARFTARGRWRERLGPMLEMLVVLGKAQFDGPASGRRYRRSN